MKILGLMSGTSLDGLDMALCEFQCINGKFDFRLLHAQTLHYPEDLKILLKNSMTMPSRELVSLDHEYGRWTGQQCRMFLESTGISADLIASHGHTVFHNPAQSYTLQIGNGHDIAVSAGIPVIYDFRSMDVALGGQGAPLVPVGDKLLFSDFAACLNLGGISNISFDESGKRIAFDICPVNMALNFLAEKNVEQFDKDGETGKTGKLIEEKLHELESLDFYLKKPPKSLGKEWFEMKFRPHIDSGEDISDLLNTVYHHISNRIASVISLFPERKILVTGGGANNKFLINLISQKTKAIIYVPGKDLVDFKEAIIFGFLGYLRYNGINNTLASVTGASNDSSGGILIKN